MSVEIVAELGSVHDGSFGNAKKLIELAKRCGANVAKFQFHIAEEESTRLAPSPSYFKGESRFDYFERTSFDDEEWKDLYRYAKSLGIEFGCSVFSIRALHRLLANGVDIVKIPSGEVTNIPLIKEIANTCSRVHVSSGMSTFEELDKTVALLAPVQKLSVLQCRSQYPTPPDRIGLNLISEMKNRYGIPIGFSDHSLGVEMSIAAVVLGATTIEKHLTFSRLMYGSDAFNALEPLEFQILTESLNRIEKSLNSQVDKNDISELVEMRIAFQKSIYYRRNMVAGDQIHFDDLKFLKPAVGISPELVETVLGRKLVRNVNSESPVKLEDLE